MISVKFALLICSVNICVYCDDGDIIPIYFKLDGTEGEKMDLHVNDVCNRTNGILSTCRKLKNCPEALDMIKRGDRPFLCGFEEKDPIVCCKLGFTFHGKPEGRNGRELSFVIGSKCEPPLVAEPLTESKSSTMCKKYSEQLCVNRSAVTVNNRQGSLPTSWTEYTTIPWFALLGAVNSNPKEFPHMALIGYGDDSDKISWQCGGTLISENFVLSAAHCTFPGPKIGLAKYVRIGDLNTASDIDDARPQQFEIIERINHPEYRPPVLYNDVALYRLDRNAKFDDYVRPLCLHQSYSLPEGAGFVTGWGRTDFVGPVSNDLQKANLTYIDSIRCNQLLNSTSQLPRGIDEKSMMCAGESDGSKDTCQGDSGGPLALQKHLRSTCLASQIGITSFGRQCGLPDSPGVYTRVAHFISWIESIVWPGPV